MQLLGIDVSKHQGSIDWDKVKAEGKVKFAMLRLGVGSDMSSQDDPTFERNVRECERVGIPWGAYLYSYALSVADAVSEAAHALRLLRGKNPKYPIAFDMEDADQYKTKHGMPSNTTLVNICDTFLSAMEKNGYYTNLYASLSWLNNQLNSPKLDKYDKWVAQWATKCSYGKPFGMWQHTNDGVVSGIVGRVDMNYAYYDFPSIIAKMKAVTSSPVAPVPSEPISVQTPTPTPIVTPEPIPVPLITPSDTLLSGVISSDKILSGIINTPVKQLYQVKVNGMVAITLSDLPVSIEIVKL